MAKKTKKTPRSASGRRAVPRSAGDALGDAEKKTAAQRAELAAERYVRWLRLLARLDKIQVGATEYLRHGPVFTDAEIDAVLAEHPKRFPHGRGDAEWHLAHVDRLRLVADLEALSNRIPVLGPGAVDAADRTDVADLLSRLSPGVRTVAVARSEPRRHDSEVVAGAMRVARIAAEVDGLLARGFEPMPDPFALDVLRRLASCPRRTAKEIAVEIAGNRQHDLDVRKVERAVERLRKLGFELPNPSRGGGYSPTAADLARLERIDRGT